MYCFYCILVYVCVYVCVCVCVYVYVYVCVCVYVWFFWPIIYPLDLVEKSFFFLKYIT